MGHVRRRQLRICRRSGAHALTIKKRERWPSFHTVFDSVVDTLPRRWPEWRVNPLWQQVSSAAPIALREMDTHA